MEALSKITQENPQFQGSEKTVEMEEAPFQAAYFFFGGGIIAAEAGDTDLRHDRTGEHAGPGTILQKNAVCRVQSRLVFDTGCNSFSQLRHLVQDINEIRVVQHSVEIDVAATNSLAGGMAFFKGIRGGPA